MTDLEYKEREKERDKMDAEIRKLLSESFFYDKKTKYYEATLFLALGAIMATILIKLT
jgi:hypothetical protein